MTASHLKHTLGQLWRENCRQYALPGQVYSNTLVSGLEAALVMHEKLGKNPGRPLLVNHSYSVQVGPVEIAARIDLLREREGMLELVGFQLRHILTNETVGHDPALLFTALTIRQLLHRPVARVCRYHFLDGTLVGSAIPPNLDRSVRAVLGNIIRGINQHIFFPIVNDNCHHCSYWSLCNSLDWQLDPQSKQPEQPKGGTI